MRTIITTLYKIMQTIIKLSAIIMMEIKMMLKQTIHQKVKMIQILTMQVQKIGMNNKIKTTKKNEDDSDDKYVEEKLKELSLKIFAAQRDEDYDYLESILTDAGSIDKDGNVFHFEGEYEHDIDFVQEPEDNLEYRYVH